MAKISSCGTPFRAAAKTADCDFIDCDFIDCDFIDCDFIDCALPA
jgi:hypothetical protein